MAESCERCDGSLGPMGGFIIRSGEHICQKCSAEYRVLWSIMRSAMTALGKGYYRFQWIDLR